ncbi:cytosine deaminase [cyanobacterium endosymbiont of Epithemia clementina EcSB]|uniref:cytosine deaminase n=1 Tax=cyanobacterium endosymbiont of Epithemia clementina EcSB TaxID=3034674 RepID=UPI0024802A1B|nr:cytosine deaminase [cyanobacterium endosymbiont of Epithemia clementina EcSB]WGT67943.1 cytosine deaminase [cyanobacterium endosymbiont of Epithemia clementina EcSB]
MSIISEIFLSGHYWLKNVHIPLCLLDKSHFTPDTREGLCRVDLEIVQEKISSIVLSDSTVIENTFIDLKGGIIFPGFVDIHTHLDKSHICERSPNLDGTFDTAITTLRKDVQAFWQPEDVYARMEFSLKCSYAHGTTAIRTHLDSFGRQADLVFEVFKRLQTQWQDKIILQAVCLVSLDYFLTDEGVILADKVAEYGGILGGVAYMNPYLEKQLNQVFTLAKERNLSLDFHVDENNDFNSVCLHKIAEIAIKHEFSNQIICSHCCSLAVQSQEIINRTIKLVKQAKIGVVSLPMCNLYLQDRASNKTPYWRGITKVHEFKKQGIPIIFASDNCRDPFFGFGDHDGLEVFKESVRIAHLDTPYSDWCSSVTKTPATLMGLSSIGRISIGLNADLILFKARYFSELLSRPQSDRIVLRRGKPINTNLPDYAELDNLVLVNKDYNKSVQVGISR